MSVSKISLNFCLFYRSILIRQNCTRLFVALTVACLVCCSSIDMPEVIVKPVDQYPNFQEKDGLRIAIDPFFDREKNKEIFGFDMLSNNILPVFVVVDNVNDESNFILKKDSFRIEPIGEIIRKPEPEKLKEEQQDVEQAGIALADGTQYISPVGFVVFGSILIVENYSLIHKIETYKHNILRKELMEKNLYPGSSQSGFVYFKFSSINNDNTILIQALNIKEGNILSFRFIVQKGE